MLTVGCFVKEKLKREKLCIFILFLLVVMMLDLTSAVTWLGIYKEEDFLANNTRGCRYIRDIYNFTKHQMHLCRRKRDSMPFVHEAAQLTVRTCQNLFRYKRWNCSTLTLLPRLLPDLNGGTKERAFVNAISSAALTYTIARGCSSSSMSECSCSSHPEQPPDGNFKWGGCGDNIFWASKFSKRFIDNRPRIDESIRRQKNMRAYPKKYSSEDDVELGNRNDFGSFSERIRNHNSDVGRQIVSDSLVTQCKCHGVSGSCSVKTCWKGLPYRFHEMGDRLISAYNSAIQVHEQMQADQLSNRIRGMSTSLVYTNKRVDFCAREHLFSTIGRECNSSANFADSCDILCCNRGYKYRVTEMSKRCKCRYNPGWYNVTCDTCVLSKKVSICN